MGGAGFLLIVIAFAALYFVLVRPAKRRQLEQRKMLNELHPGDEVLTAGGIYGEIVDVGESEVSVRIAPGLDVRVARRAIAAVTPAETAAGELEPADEPDVAGPTPGT
jgi:preprotein translocase subunit YajC